MSTLPETPPPSPPRRRGAPEGNRNALKHGFYARHFKKNDLTDLQKHEFSGLEEEIKLIRLYIRHVTELTAASGPADLAEAISLLRVLCLASASLTRLIKTQHLLFNRTDEFDQLIDQALAELSEELNLTP